jgi:hypothetical protein
MNKGWNMLKRKVEAGVFFGYESQVSMADALSMGVANFLFYNDVEHIYFYDLDDEKMAQKLRTFPNWYQYGDDFFFSMTPKMDRRINDLRNSLAKEIAKLGVDIMDKYFFREGYDYFDDMLTQCTMQKQPLLQFLNTRRGRFNNYLVYQDVKEEFMTMIGSQTDLVTDFSNEYTGDFAEEVQKFKDIVLEIFDISFKNISEIITTRPIVDPAYYKQFMKEDPQFNQIFQIADQVSKEGLVADFDPTKKEEYLARLKEINFHKLFVQFLVSKILPKSISDFEDTLFKKIMLNELQLNQQKLDPLVDPERLFWVRQLAVIFGQLPVNPLLDRSVEFKSSKSFLKLVEDGRLLI